jgi:biotin carboxyl carrier protein
MRFDVLMDGKTRRIEVSESAEGMRATLDGVSVEMDAELLQPGVLSLRIGARVYRCWLDETLDGRQVVIAGRRYAYSVEDPRSLKRRAHRGAMEGTISIKAPMPGRVVNLLAAVGDEVTAKQGVVVIEAMKMQNELKSPKAGRVVRLHVAAGDTVQAGAVLAEIE